MVQERLGRQGSGAVGGDSFYGWRGGGGDWMEPMTERRKEEEGGWFNSRDGYTDMMQYRTPPASQGG